MQQNYLTLLVAPLLTCIVACSASAPTGILKPPHAVSKAADEKPSTPAQSLHLNQSRAPLRASARVTSLEEALIKVATQNPEVKSYFHRLKSVSALVEQAALMPNPELEVELENFGGNTDEFNQLETSITLAQRLELGGKRHARTNLAEANKELVNLQAKQALAEIIAETKIAFVDVIISQSMVEIFANQIELSRAVVSFAKRKLGAGAILAIEKTKAEIAFNHDKLNLKTAKSDLLMALTSLASLWGGTTEDISLNRKSISLACKQSDSISYINAIPYQIAKQNVSVAKNNLLLEKANAVPDAGFGVGFKRAEESNTNSLIGAFSIELPVINRNQGAIRSANRLWQIALLETQNEELRTSRKLRNLQIQLKTVSHEYRSIRDSILPSANIAFKQANDAYLLGRTSFLDLVDAQRTLVDSKLKRLKLLRSCVEIDAELENIAGTAVSAFKENIQ